MLRQISSLLKYLLFHSALSLFRDTSYCFLGFNYVVVNSAVTVAGVPSAWQSTEITLACSVSLDEVSNLPLMRLVFQIEPSPAFISRVLCRDCRTLSFPP